MSDKAFDATALRQWLIDYLIVTIGCDPGEVDAEASMADLGVSSRDSVVLSGELSELLHRPVSPVEFWQNPTINALAAYLTAPEPAVVAEPERARPGRGPADEPIALVGMGCRFPGGIGGPDDLWRFLLDGRSGVAEVPADRWRPFDDGTPAVRDVLSRTTRWGAFLGGVDEFDADFFEITPREAARMDPQQRLLLEVAWEALEHAGIPATSLRRSQTGVFIGACVSEYGYLGSNDLPGVDAWSNIGGALSIIANRLSYVLDLRGPSITVDTACSSSLVAVHLACQSLRMQECGVAIAGGVNLLLSPAIFAGFDRTGALSPTGACHAFDAAADGFVRGEGCGVVVLKRLCDAQADGDRVLAVVRGSAVNQDGRSNGLLAPNPAAQMEVLRSAYAGAGVAPREVDYVEAHGTGTLLGDPIEARALATVLGRGRSGEAPLLIGAVKSNLGHLEAAAGIAGLMKTVLAVYHGALPANLHYQTPNPHIPFAQLRLKVVAEHMDWPLVDRPRRAGVSAFGFGGTNAHVVVEQAPLAPSGAGHGRHTPGPAVTTLVVSGKSPQRVASLAGCLAQWMADDGADVSLPDVAHTLNHHRTPHPVFATVCARDRGRAIAGLTALSQGMPADGVAGPHDGPCRAGTVFVYSGQGSQWPGMGRRLLADEPAFAAAVSELEAEFVTHVGFSLRQVIADGESLRGDAHVQPVLMGLQLALTRLWGHYGVHPDAVIGHSMGEVTAAVVSGALSLSEGLRVIATRSRLMSRLAGQGAVALLRLDAGAAQRQIAGRPEVSVAVYSSPRQTVVAGPVADVDAVIADAARQDHFARRVNMEVASHTALMDPILPELSAALADLTPRAPRIPFYSTVVDTTAPLVDGGYWVANLRQPVRLSQAFAAAAAEHATFIEISAHPTLVQAVTETLESATHHHSVGTLTRDGDDTVAFHTNLNAIHTDRPPNVPHPPEPHATLPTTPWHHSRHWTELRPSLGGNRAGSATTVSDGVLPPEWLCELTWPPQPLPPSGIAAEGNWLFIGDEALGQEMARIIGESRTRVLGAQALDPAADAGALAEAVAGADRVLYAPPPQGDQLSAAAGHALFNAARRLVAVLTAAPSKPMLVLLTRNAQPMFDGDRANPAQAVLWGLGRTLALEHPENWCVAVDVDESVPSALAARYVLSEAQHGGGEDQVVYRTGTRHVPRLRPRRTPIGPSGEIGPSGSHLVIGATGNIGPHLIGQLVAMGARTVVAVSRRPAGRLDELTDVLAAQGARLVTVAADAADEAAMAALFDRFGADLPPLEGIYLTAFGGAPVTLADMTDDDVAAMFRPKLDAAAVLHRLSLRAPVDRFVLFSSISGLTGSRWLAHYTASSTFLDTFAYARRAAGLPATAVNWGLWKSLADHQNELEQQVTVGSGLQAMPDEVAIRALSWISAPGAPARSTIAAADWPRLAAAYRTRSAFRIVDGLLPDAPGADPASSETELRQALRACEPERRHALLAGHVTTLVAAAMGLESPQLLDPGAGFFQFGMDSLMTVTLQRALSESLGAPLPTSVVFDYPTVDALTGYLAATLPELTELAAHAAEAEAADDALPADDYDGFSEDELLQALSERLS